MPKSLTPRRPARLHLHRVTFFTLLLSITGLLSISGCSFLSPCVQEISVVSDPSGATVYLNGTAAGTTPLVTVIRRDQPVAVVVEREGYESISRTLETGLSTTGIVDLISGSGWIVPYLGLLSAGAWDFDTPHIFVPLRKYSSCNECARCLPDGSNDPDLAPAPRRKVGMNS